MLLLCNGNVGVVGLCVFVCLVWVGFSVVWCVCGMW